MVILGCILIYLVGVITSFILINYENNDRVDSFVHPINSLMSWYFVFFKLNKQ